MEQLDFQIMLTNDYYVNPNGIHLCFPMEIKKSSNEAQDIDSNQITVNNFFGHLLKQISETKLGSDKNQSLHFLPMKLTSTLTLC